MRVRCIRSELTQGEIARIGGSVADRNSWAVTPGREYLVFGLTFALGRGDLGRGTWVDYEEPSQGEYLLFAPIALFEVVCPSASRLWELRADADAATLWPGPFYEPAFHDRLSDGAKDALVTFRRVRTLLEAEEPPQPKPT
jgi:hypothetical protein